MRNEGDRAARNGLPVIDRVGDMLDLLERRPGGMTIRDLSQSLALPRSSVYRSLNTLEAHGLVRRSPDGVYRLGPHLLVLAAQVVVDPADKRRRRLALTARAGVDLRAAKPLWRAIEDLFAQHCREQGIDLLQTLTAFERVLAPTLAGTIVARAAAQDRSALRIVPFDPALREHFYRLNEAWLRKYFYVEEIDHRVLSNPEAEILQSGGAILFAMLGDEVVGTCALLHESDGVYELTKMAVDEQRQGLGIGRALMEAAIAEFRLRRGLRLFLETNSKLTPAVRLYESMGFEHQPSIKPDSHYDRANVYMVWRDPQAAASAS